MIKRKIIDKIMQFLIYSCGVIVCGTLLFIFGYILIKGITSLNLNFFTRLPKPVGEKGGGMVNAIVGSFTLVGLASLWAVPLSLLAGVYLAEFSGKEKESKFASILRFLLDVLSGIPSIVIGIFAYSLVVVPMRKFSAISGAFALGMIMIPTIARTTEEMIRMVPRTIKEASLALGISNWKTIVFVVLNTAKPGILTGILLAVARIFGETAPLLFTAFGNRFWHRSLTDPIAALPLQIFVYAISPYEDWHQQAWAGALVLILIVYSTILISRKILLKYK
ncbi:MAG: phosphate ABC transporter permease PstA [Elusimicrobiota bacterium]|nr:phosphate ABC transporter permease PstA [Elusimicrobiota bacterium]